jgi:hypothetical protein
MQEAKMRGQRECSSSWSSLCEQVWKAKVKICTNSSSSRDQHASATLYIFISSNLQIYIFISSTEGTLHFVPDCVPCCWRGKRPFINCQTAVGWYHGVLLVPISGIISRQLAVASSMNEGLTLVFGGLSWRCGICDSALELPAGAE